MSQVVSTNVRRGKEVKADQLCLYKNYLVSITDPMTISFSSERYCTFSLYQRLLPHVWKIHWKTCRW